MNGEFLYNSEQDQKLQELKRAAFEVLYEHEGCDRQDWIDWIIADHGEELAEVIGDNPYDTYPQLEDYWDSMDYEDPNTGVCLTYRDWAEYFSCWEHKEVYDKLVEANNKLKSIKSMI
jgi:hypothetical protein